MHKVVAKFPKIGSVDNRFPETFKAPDVAQNPGPGQYHPEIFESKKVCSSTIKELEFIDLLRIISSTFFPTI